MAWFRRRQSASVAGRERVGGEADQDSIEHFVRTRYGVEAYLEPRTTVTQTTVMLVASDGEWIRRRVADPHSARRLAHRLSIPIYHVHLVGYPQRMRDYNERRKRADSTGATG